MEEMVKAVELPARQKRYDRPELPTWFDDNDEKPRSS
jgi:hypothetical protein